MIYSILNEDQVPITNVRTGVPTEFERIVNKALTKYPDDRYQHIDDLKVDLKSLKNNLEKQKSIPGFTQTNGEEKRKLAAIMFSDMVGYSAIAQKNESLAIELLEEHRNILRPIFPNLSPPICWRISLHRILQKLKLTDRVIPKHMNIYKREIIIIINYS